MSTKIPAGLASSNPTNDGQLYDQTKATEAAGAAAQNRLTGKGGAKKDTNQADINKDSFLSQQGALTSGLDKTASEFNKNEGKALGKTADQIASLVIDGYTVVQEQQGATFTGNAGIGNAGNVTASPASPASTTGIDAVPRKSIDS